MIAATVTGSWLAQLVTQVSFMYQPWCPSPQPRRHPASALGSGLRWHWWPEGCWWAARARPGPGVEPGRVAGPDGRPRLSCRATVTQGMVTGKAHWHWCRARPGPTRMRRLIGPPSPGPGPSQGGAEIRSNLKMCSIRRITSTNPTPEKKSAQLQLTIAQIC